MATYTDYINRASAGGDGSTNGTAGGNAAYASFSSWEANTQTAHSGTGADDYVVNCAKGGSGSNETSTWTIDFATNITTGSITIQGNASDSTGRNLGNAFWDTSCFALVTGAGASGVMNQESKLTLRGLQLESTDTGNFTSLVRGNGTNNTNLTVESCRMRSSQPGGVYGMNGSNPSTFSGTNLWRNNIIVYTGSGVALSWTSGVHATVTVNVYHNTIYTSGSIRGVLVSGMGGTGSQIFNIKNNAVANTTNPFDLQATSGVAPQVNTDYNWTDSGADGTTNEQDLPALASVFTSAGTGNSADFSLLQALATGGSVGSITTDVNGTTYGSPPDAGAFAFSAGLTTVEKDLDLRWLIANQIDKDLDLRWAILNAVEKDVDVRWAILNTVQKDLDLRWAILNQINKDIDLRWAILNAVAKDLDLRWHILQTIDKDLELQWEIQAVGLSNVTKDLDLRWSIAQTIAKDLDLRWLITNVVEKNVELQWAVRNEVVKEVDLRWAVTQLITKDLDLRWALLNSVLKDVDFRWLIRALVSKDVDLRWRIGEGGTISIANLIGSQPELVKNLVGGPDFSNLVGTQ
jgi:hypothetical protein